jgi:A-factor biosynthesis hotdog domain
VTVALVPAASIEFVIELEFERTVTRKLVHRQALSEVFLTDSRRVDDTSFVAGAQLPPSHAYYTDHRVPGVDPLLLLECCRQAETHAVHAHFGAPLDTKFVLCDWSLRLRDTALPSGPAEVVIATTTHDAQWRGDALRELSYRMRVEVNGRHTADVTMHVRYLPEVAYRLLRGRRREGDPPSSTAYRRGPGTDVAPWRVARSLPDNVILIDPDIGPHGVRALLRIAGGHPSLFDHAQDHVPGMVLMEAGRQAALLVAGQDWRVTGIEASFAAYAELDSPITVIGQARGEDRVGVTVEQDGKTIAEAIFTGMRSR